MAKKEKKGKGKDEEAEAPPPAGAEGAEGEAPAKKKLAGKTLILFIVLPAVLVLGGGGTAAMMLLGGKPAEHAEADEHGDKKPPKKAKEKHAEKKDDGHGGGDKGGGHGDAKGGDAKPEDVGHLGECEEEGPCYYMMPTQIVNLAASEGEGSPLLQLDLALESSDQSNFDELPRLMPRLKDQYQSFLRELRVDELNGSGGAYRLRQELLKRINLVIAPARVDAVLVQNMLIQQ